MVLGGTRDGGLTYRRMVGAMSYRGKEQTYVEASRPWEFSRPRPQQDMRGNLPYSEEKMRQLEAAVKEVKNAYKDHQWHHVQMAHDIARDHGIMYTVLIDSACFAVDDDSRNPPWICWPDESTPDDPPRKGDPGYEEEKNRVAAWRRLRREKHGEIHKRKKSVLVSVREAAIDADGYDRARDEAIMHEIEQAGARDVENGV